YPGLIGGLSQAPRLPFLSHFLQGSAGCAGMTEPLHEIAGRWALITGASTGIGKVFATELAKKRAQLVVCARDATRLTALAEELRAISGGEVRVVACDLETVQGVGTLINEVQSWSIE